MLTLDQIQGLADILTAHDSEQVQAYLAQLPSPYPNEEPLGGLSDLAKDMVVPILMEMDRTDHLKPLFASYEQFFHDINDVKDLRANHQKRINLLNQFRAQELEHASSFERLEKLLQRVLSRDSRIPYKQNERRAVRKDGTMVRILDRPETAVTVITKPVGETAQGELITVTAPIGPAAQPNSGTAESEQEQMPHKESVASVNGSAASSSDGSTGADTATGSTEPVAAKRPLSIVGRTAALRAELNEVQSMISTLGSEGSEQLTPAQAAVTRTDVMAGSPSGDQDPIPSFLRRTGN